MDSVVTVATDGTSNMAIKTDGSLWAWGTNKYGQLGDGTTEDKYIPVKIMDSVATVAATIYGDVVIINNSVATVAVTTYGDKAIKMAIKTDGSLWAWGSNKYGQLGDGTTVDKHAPVKIMDSVAKLSLYYVYSAVIKTDGSLWQWGLKDWGLYNGTIPKDRKDSLLHTTPEKILDDAADIPAASGDKYLLVTKTDGSVWFWTYGYGNYLNTPYPVKILDGVSRLSDK